MFHTQEPLRDDYSLMDIAYIYTWRRVITAVVITIDMFQLHKTTSPYSLLGYYGHRCNLDLSLFSPPNLRGRLADRHQTLPHVRLVTQIYKIRSEIWVAPSLRNLAAQNIKISARFRTTSRLDREYPRNATRLRQSENCVANYGHSRTGKLNSVYFGPQTAKNRTGVLTHPTGGDQAGHRHASIQIFALNIIVFCKSLSKKISNA